ncbi:spore coat U domain-containing protein [Stenotrophomonas maltophilia]|uniref:Csu type fimbrial protein n=1 Tax=Stenotrophomonas maltophilia TaxID=40324 RepID=UPI001075D634|nr:spore coat U domain-containing protein [Stenotrophomonas maltophilia]
MRVLLPAALLLSSLLCVQPAQAAVSCVATADPLLPFGNVRSEALGASTATLNITVDCSSGPLSSIFASAAVRVCIGIGTGSAGAGSAGWRTMASTSGDSMSFQLYNNPGYSQVTGLLPRGSPAAQEMIMTYPVRLITGGSGTVSTRLYARIPANQLLAAGNYGSTFGGANVVLSWAWNEALLGWATMPASCNGGASGTNSTSAAFNFRTTATVLPQCGSYVTTDLNFGTVTGGTDNTIDQVSSLTLSCLKNTAFQVGLDNGQNTVNQSNARRMRATIAGSSHYLRYELYRDAARTQRWGSTLDQDTVSGIGTGASQRLIIYGRLPPITLMSPAGSYSDQVQITITY